MNRRIIILENTFYTVLSLRMEIMHFLKHHHYEVIVVWTGPHNDITELEKQGFQSFDVGSVVMNPFKALLFFWKLATTTNAIDPMAILSFTIRPNIFGSIMSRILHIPIISNVTGTGPLTTDSSMLYNIIRWLYKFAFQKNQTVFFQNSDDMNYFLENQYVTATQVKLLPGSGVDTSYYLPREKTSSGFSFLMISRLIRDKGVIEYIEAAKIVKEKYPEIEFKLLGPFWTQSIGKNTIKKEEVDEWVQAGLIHYLGYTMDIRPFVADADCIVLPSYREGCANVLMQSASMAKPLIASNVTGCKNLVEHEVTGLLCEVKNAEDTARNMIAMYTQSQEQRNIMGIKGREKMMKEYQKSIVLNSYLHELESIL